LQAKRQQSRGDGQEEAEVRLSRILSGVGKVPSEVKLRSHAPASGLLSPNGRVKARTSDSVPVEMRGSFHRSQFSSRTFSVCAEREVAPTLKRCKPKVNKGL
jgi:hypothetical protein